MAILVMAATALEKWWEPSLLTVSLYYMWVAVGNVIVFFVFLGSFLRVAEENEGRAAAEPPSEVPAVASQLRR